MSASLIIGAKAPVIAYPELIAARKVNASKGDNTIEISFVEDKKAAAASFNGETEDVLTKLSAAYRYSERQF